MISQQQDSVHGQTWTNPIHYAPKGHSSLGLIGPEEQGAETLLGMEMGKPLNSEDSR